MQAQYERTIDGQVAQGRTCGPLYLNIRILQEKQDGLEGVSVHFSYICQLSASSSFGFIVAHTSLSDLGKGQTGTSLKVDIVRVHECAQCS